MKRKIVWLILSCLMVLSLVMASCGGEEEEEEEVTVPETKEEVTVTEEEEEEEEVQQTGIIPWWKKPDPGIVPQYGGTFTISSGRESTFDPYFAGRDMGSMPLWYDSMMMGNWTGVDPEECSFPAFSVSGKYYTGYLAENVEYQDYETIIYHIRKGVNFQNIPPVNGREMTAYDVEYCLHRITGLGSGFTEQSPYLGINLYGPPVSITATDKYTVVVKLPAPSISYTRSWLQGHPCYLSIYPHELIEQYGNLRDWSRVIGTGPFILKDYIAASSYTSVRNPDYWDYDEFFPENQLPYVDAVKVLIIPDSATMRAAMRTGKIDYMSRLKWEDAAAFAESNPEIWQTHSFSDCMTIAMLVDVKPFDDVRVRQALQMSIDLKTVADSYYGGFWDGTPAGVLNSVGGFKDWVAKYDDWPQEVKDGFAYNPEGAKELLAEAGYPEGFKCTLTCSTAADLDLLQIIQAYFKDIGVDIEINTMEPTVAKSYCLAGKAEMSAGQTHFWFTWQYPLDMVNILSKSYHDYSITHIDDPYFEDLNAKMQKTLDMDELKKLWMEAEIYAISHHWRLTVTPTVSFKLVQPWVKRLADVTTMNLGAQYARLWIDQELKESMGK